ncbi:hypothetical protein SPHV1_830002 [Novosphingobium sp. KN65.2]|nr:hypothetical protein SPHV1_830002 [Novosphingobium sp. KN65.2]
MVTTVISASSRPEDNHATPNLLMPTSDGTFLNSRRGHFYLALTDIRDDNKDYVNTDTTAVHVNCVQCDGERLAVTWVFQQYQRPCSLPSPRRPGRLKDWT